jgi:hypothetical protein
MGTEHVENEQTEEDMPLNSSGKEVGITIIRNSERVFKSNISRNKRNHFKMIEDSMSRTI